MKDFELFIGKILSLSGILKLASLHSQETYWSNKNYSVSFS